MLRVRGNRIIAHHHVAGHERVAGRRVKHDVADAGRTGPAEYSSGFEAERRSTRLLCWKRTAPRQLLYAPRYCAARLEPERMQSTASKQISAQSLCPHAKG